MKSECFAGSSVQFPEFTGERVHMQEFIPSNGLPVELERWQKTVDAMLVGVNAPGSVYLMIDQAEVKAGGFHRRPGLHVDGYWYAGGHTSVPRHNPTPQPELEPNPNPKHIHPIPGTPQHLMIGNYETLILASNVEGCVAAIGEWDGIAGVGGDCDMIDRRSLKSVVMRSGVAWFGETGSMLHMAIKLPTNVKRTVVRLNVPGYCPN